LTGVTQKDEEKNKIKQKKNKYQKQDKIQNSEFSENFFCLSFDSIVPKGMGFY